MIDFNFLEDKETDSESLSIINSLNMPAGILLINGFAFSANRALPSIDFTSISFDSFSIKKSDRSFPLFNSFSKIAALFFLIKVSGSSFSGRNTNFI